MRSNTIKKKKFKIVKSRPSRILLRSPGMSSLLGIGSNPIDDNREVPADLDPRVVPHGSATRIARGITEEDLQSGVSLKDAYLRNIANDVNIIASTSVLDRGLLGRSITVGTVATKIIESQYLRGYTILNPQSLLGFTSTGTILASAARTTAGNTQSSSLGVANFRDMHLFLSVTAVSGGASLKIYGQAIDPVSSNWSDTQVLYKDITATGTYYANMAGFGLASDFATRWTISAGSITFSIGFVVKDGLPGTAAGVARTIYLGGPGVTVSSGFPLLEGQSRSYYLRENTDLHAVASTSLDIRVFDL